MRLKDFKTKSEVCLKAQIHAGGRGKAGGVKLIKDISLLEKSQSNDGKVQHQTGPGRS